LEIFIKILHFSRLKLKTTLKYRKIFENYSKKEKNIMLMDFLKWVISC